MSDHKYLAFDVHKSTITVVVLILEGKLVSQAVMQTDANSVRDFLRGLSGQLHLTFEEGTHAQWLYELTRPLVAHLIVCNARLINSKGNKSDRLDAFHLAQMLRAGLLKAVYHASATTETLKQLVHNYESLTEDTTRCMNRLKSVFRSRAIACSGRDVYLSRNQTQWLAKLTQQGLRLRAESLYKQLDHLRPLRRDAKKALLREAGLQEAFKRLREVPGLGPIRVAQILAQVGTPHRFSSKRQFWKYCGLSVITHSSSDWEYSGGKLERRAKSVQTRGLTRQYSRRLKLVFKSAALEALKDGHIKRIYTRLVEKGTRPEMARLTIARKIAAVALKVWKSGEGYDEQKMTKAA